MKPVFRTRITINRANFAKTRNVALLKSRVSRICHPKVPLSIGWCVKVQLRLP